MELLKQLYSIHVPTFHEWPLICFKFFTIELITKRNEI